MTNLALALVAVFVITSVIIASVHASLMVVLCVVMVDVDILGLMYMWGLTIDSVTIINLVLAVGLAVDYSAHIGRAFFSTPRSMADGDPRPTTCLGLFSSFVFKKLRTVVFVWFRRHAPKKKRSVLRPQLHDVHGYS